MASIRREPEKVRNQAKTLARCQTELIPSRVGAPFNPRNPSRSHRRNNMSTTRHFSKNLEIDTPARQFHACGGVGSGGSGAPVFVN